MIVIYNRLLLITRIMTDIYIVNILYTKLIKNIKYSMNSNFFTRPPISTYLFTCKCIHSTRVTHANK